MVRNISICSFPKRKNCSHCTSWTRYSPACQPLSTPRSSALSWCTGSSSIEVLNINEVQTTITDMTMSFSTSLSSTDTHFLFVDMYTSRAFEPSDTASTVDPSPSGYLSTIRSNPPSCVNTLNETFCPLLYIAARQCWSEAYPPGPPNCFCSTLSITNCTQLCQSTAKDRISYFDWSTDLCSGYASAINSTNNATFISTWPDESNRSAAIFQDLYPFTWSLAPSENTKQNIQCPSKAMKLLPFAINNVIVGIATWFLGKRTLIKWLGRGIIGWTEGAYGVAGSKWWPAVSILVVAINVFANLMTALLVKSIASLSSPDLGTLLILWLARPRSAFVATALVSIKKNQSMYISVGVSTLFSEFLLQSLGGVIMVQTINFLTGRGYMHIKALQYIPGSSRAFPMYSSALAWVIFIAFFYVYVIWEFLFKNRVFSLILPALKHGLQTPFKVSWQILLYMRELVVDLWEKCRYRRARQNPDEGYDMGEIHAPPAVTKGWAGYLKQMGLDRGILTTVSRSFYLFLLPYMAQWLFWIGLVELYGDR
jgi:hypothetical protein